MRFEFRTSDLYGFVYIDDLGWLILNQNQQPRRLLDLDIFERPGMDICATQYYDVNIFLMSKIVGIWRKLFWQPETFRPRPILKKVKSRELHSRNFK